MGGEDKYLSPHQRTREDTQRFLGRRQTMNEDCIFCQQDNKIDDFGPFFIRLDRFPVTDGHVEIVPYRHISSISELNRNEWDILLDALNKYAIGDYNLGINCGE